ncbi:MAG: hypothetical protein R2706_09025 [Acidimicrobiales bacterium]
MSVVRVVSVVGVVTRAAAVAAVGSVVGESGGVRAGPGAGCIGGRTSVTGAEGPNTEPEHHHDSDSAKPRG